MENSDRSRSKFFFFFLTVSPPRDRDPTFHHHTRSLQSALSIVHKLSVGTPHNVEKRSAMSSGEQNIHWHTIIHYTGARADVNLREERRAASENMVMVVVVVVVVV